MMPSAPQRCGDTMIGEGLMATLVLTAVGGIVGGPIGAAIGAAVGQQIDAQIFKPKGREGPRLADLKLQASTYGQQIPQLFGTMRVAGSVIWATDLIERRQRHSGGKGRPSTTEYSYAVSLAVALSSRRLRAIRRIWADGNLLRGSSGSFQERCIFRWHDGSEDQPVDPLIASAVGIASASAFRGLSYAVFEELELASFGNRIPSLTFEVEADIGAIDVGMVGDALLGEAGCCAGRTLYMGYAASGDRVRDALAPLLEADGVRLISAPDGWRLAPTAQSGAPLALGDFSVAARAQNVRDCTEQRRAPLSVLPGRIRVRHYEPERDYQLGEQDSIVAGGGRQEQRIDLPAVLGAGAARGLAQDLAAAAADGREAWVWRGDLAAIALPVGGIIALADGSRWRLAARTVRGETVQIELRRYQPFAVATPDADPGVPVGAPDWPDATGIVRLFDIPSFGARAASAPQILIAAAGSNDGWRGADAWFVAAPDAAPVSIGLLRPAAALGELSEPLAAADGLLMDLANTAVVSLINRAMTLESVDDVALLGGANRAMLGSEMLQFGVAEALGGEVWRLSRLLRGRAGTAMDVPHSAATPFVLLGDPAPILLPEEFAELARTGNAILEWAARNSFVTDTIAIPVDARALRPLAPVHGRVSPNIAGGADISWARCSRVDTGWRDGVDLPLGESRESYLIELSPSVAGLGPWQSNAPSLYLSPAERAALPVGSMLAIRQLGDFAPSLPLFLSVE